MLTIAAIMACYDRRSTTLECLERLFAASAAASVAIDVYLCDDGSTDGTADAVRARFPEVQIEKTNNLYWAAGMRVAERAAEESGRRYDFLFWLNDDVKLDTTAIEEMVVQTERFPKSIIVGATRSEATLTVNYSGLNRGGYHPLSFDRAQPTNPARLVTTFNGNAVLVPNEIAQSLGGIDGGFSHAFADIDYGLRAAALGYTVRLHPKTVGTCRDNPPQPALNMFAEWKRFIGVKGGGNVPSTARILRRHGGTLWRMHFLSSYILWWLRAIHRHGLQKARSLGPLSGQK